MPQELPLDPRSPSGERLLHHVKSLIRFVGRKPTYSRIKELVRTIPRSLKESQQGGDSGSLCIQLLMEAEARARTQTGYWRFCRFAHFLLEVAPGWSCQERDWIDRLVA